MKTLVLLRHAKSSWDNLDLNDFDRPLNNRGREAAKRMGAFIAENGLVPDYILCSPSVRTRGTLELMQPAFSGKPETEFPEDLYAAGARALMAAIRSASDASNHLLVIGHNPGLQSLALKLAVSDRSDRNALRRMAEKYPTAALAHYELDIDSWADAGPENSALIRFVTPKELS